MADPVALITCDFWFEASHVLARRDWSAAENERVFGACSRLHGHSYHLRVTVKGPIDRETGMVMNFTHLKALVRERVIERLDHHHLNDIVPGIATCENILYWIARSLLPGLGETLNRLELWETRTSAAVLTAEELSNVSP